MNTFSSFQPPQGNASTLDSITASVNFPTLPDVNVPHGSLGEQFSNLYGGGGSGGHVGDHPNGSGAPFGTLAGKRAAFPGGCPTGQLIRLQSWLTLIGAAEVNQDIIQPARGWLDGGRFATLHLKIQIKSISNCTVVLESASKAEGPWTTALSHTTTEDTMAVISSEGGDYKFARFVRWRVARTNGTAWFTCFQILAMPGTSAAQMRLAPRQA